MALRQLLPEVRDRPVAEVFHEARSSPGWVLAVCPPDLTQRVRELAERTGLVAVIENLPADERAVPEDEVIAELTASGRAVADFILVGGLVCSSVAGGLTAMIIDDSALARAAIVYLRKVGVREYASYDEFAADNRRGDGDCQ